MLNKKEYVEDEDQLTLSHEESMMLILQWMPDIDIDPDISDRDGIFYTSLRPSGKCDVLLMDYSLIQLIRSTSVKDSVRVTALVTLAALIGHGISHSLEFRCIRNGLLRQDGTAYETPLGATCGEAGTAWERRTFGGKIHPIREREYQLGSLLGVVVESERFNYHCMKLEVDWMVQLFTEDTGLATTTHCSIRHHWSLADHTSWTFMTPMTTNKPR